MQKSAEEHPDALIWETRIEGPVLLDATVFYPQQEGPAPGALLIHGWQSAQDRMHEQATHLSEQGMTGLTFDLPGHGKSGGSLEALSRKDHVDAAVRAYDFFIKTGRVKQENVTVIGSSFGGYIAALLTKERQVKSLILRVPSDYPDDGFDSAGRLRGDSLEVVSWRSQVRDWQSSKALQALHEFAGNVLIVESQKDDVVVSQVIQSYVHAADPGRSTHILMEGAGHSISSDPVQKQKFVELVDEWLKDRI